MSSLKDVRLEMRKFYRDVKGGVITDFQGTKRCYMLRQIGDIIIAAEIEKRIAD